MAESSAVVDLHAMGQAARLASRVLSSLSTTRKNEALASIAVAIEQAADVVLDANALDIEQAREKGLSDALIDRLLLTPERVRALADDTRKVISLPDPVGSDISARVLENGLRLSKRRMPIGVIGVIYEARPNVTVDVATLALKTGNATILRGGSETLRSNMALVQAIGSALVEADVPQAAVQYIGSRDRALVGELLRLDEYVDMIIPRGGSSLHRRCREEATIPVITGGIGICHVFADASADLERAVDIVENAKVQRPSVCNALDTLLVHRDVAADLIPAVIHRLAARGVTFRLDPEALSVVGGLNGHADAVQPAGPDDFDQEWLSLVLGIRVVEDLDQAVEHIHTHSTEHSDAILTRNLEHANRFVAEITSAAVLVNASTRFNDGGQFGLGAEVAVSTQKLHARGPMGLEELTTYKWVVEGDGHVRP